jgi:hypothetical protein
MGAAKAAVAQVVYEDFLANGVPKVVRASESKLAVICVRLL